MADSGPLIEDGQLSLFMIGPKAVKQTLATVVKLGRAGEVTSLELTGNQIKKLPDISAFTKLQTLVLDQNLLSGPLKVSSPLPDRRACAPPEHLCLLHPSS